MENIYKKEDKIIIEIPFYSERYNPYMSDSSYHSKMNNIVGVIVPVKNCDTPDIGFAYNIDMDYKGKPDQTSEIFYKFYGKRKDFIDLCKKLKIEIREYLKCAYCEEAIYGVFSSKKKGNKCYSCMLKEI